MIQNVKRAQANLNKCHAPIGVWSESYRHEIRLTAELMLLSARIGRALVSTWQDCKRNGSDAQLDLNTSADSPTNAERCNGLNILNDQPLQSSNNNSTTKKNPIGIGDLQPTFRTDIANK